MNINLPTRLSIHRKFVPRKIKKRFDIECCLCQSKSVTRKRIMRDAKKKLYLAYTCAKHDDIKYNHVYVMDYTRKIRITAEKSNTIPRMESIKIIFMTEDMKALLEVIQREI